MTVIGTTHGMMTLAAQACIKAGLEVTEAVNLTPAANGDALTEAVARTMDTTDAVLVAVAPTVPHALDPVIAAETAGPDKLVLAVQADQPESVRILRSAAQSTVNLPSYDDAAAAANALAALVRAVDVMHRPPYQAPAPEADLDKARTLVEGWLRDAPQGRELGLDECAELLDAVGLPVGAMSERPVMVTGWQDPVFGPLLSGSTGDGWDAMTLLVPFDERESADLAAHVGLDQKNLLRLSALLDARPEVATLRVRFSVGTAAAISGAVAPAPLRNPYLRRLRRAPVE